MGTKGSSIYNSYLQSGGDSALLLLENIRQDQAVAHGHTTGQHRARVYPSFANSLGIRWIEPISGLDGPLQRGKESNPPRPCSEWWS